jgi:hypothetical protein
MSKSLESALIIDLTPSLEWGAALPVVNLSAGTLTPVDENARLDITQYARRDREFQHRDMINAAAVAKVAVHAQTVWNGVVDYLRMQGNAGVMDSTGTNVQLPLDTSELVVPITGNGTVSYVLNSSVPYDAVRITDKDLYARDTLLFETLARAASIFPYPPITQNDPSGTVVGSTSIWTTGDPAVKADDSIPNAAQALNTALFTGPDAKLTERDNQIAAYVARLAQALKNPFAFATRIYVAINGVDTRESETYVLTDNVYVQGQSYSTGDELTYAKSPTPSGTDTVSVGLGEATFSTTAYLAGDSSDIGRTITLASGEVFVITAPVSTTVCHATPDVSVAGSLFTISNPKKWYRANYTTSDVPGGVAWAVITTPSRRQFLAEPCLSNRNRIVYSVPSSTLQWFRESLDTVHVPQIVGLLVPGILPGQSIETIPVVPESKDSQFYRQKAGRVVLDTGIWSAGTSIYPTAGPQTDGGIDSIFQGVKSLTLPVPMATTGTYFGVFDSGTYALSALVRPSAALVLPGNNLFNSTEALVTLTPDGGVTCPSIGTSLKYSIALPAGAWKMFITFSNDASAASETYGFGVSASIGGQSILSDTLPLYYTDQYGSPLPKGTVITSTGISISSTGQSSTLILSWTSGVGLFHVEQLKFVTEDSDTSHYVMEATWQGQTSKLDVIGQRDMPDVMRFTFYNPVTVTNAHIGLTWKARSGSDWNSTRTYYPGDQVVFNLTYYKALDVIEAGVMPGATPNWVEVGYEPQLPLVVESLHLQKWQTTTPTPMTPGFSGFKQDMLERANRADQDAYRAAVASSGTVYPEFTVDGRWEVFSTEEWMSFQEVYNTRLRDQGTGAYRLSQPGDVGQPALVPAGLEYDVANGTVTSHYPAYAAYPTIQALQPWMIEKGVYVAQSEFWSPSTM